MFVAEPKLAVILLLEIGREVNVVTVFTPVTVGSPTPCGPLWPLRTSRPFRSSSSGSTRSAFCSGSTLQVLESKGKGSGQCGTTERNGHGGRTDVGVNRSSSTGNTGTCTCCTRGTSSTGSAFAPVSPLSPFIALWTLYSLCTSGAFCTSRTGSTSITFYSLAVLWHRYHLSCPVDLVRLEGPCAPVSPLLSFIALWTLQLSLTLPITVIPGIICIRQCSSNGIETSDV